MASALNSANAKALHLVTCKGWGWLARDVDLDEVLVLAATLSWIAPHLTERRHRPLLGAAARALGYGGVSRVAPGRHGALWRR